MDAMSPPIHLQARWLRRRQMKFNRVLIESDPASIRDPDDNGSNPADW